MIWTMLILFPQTSILLVRKLFFVFEDNEAVIIKGRSPTMRHVSRTHRVALDWLFGRINLDPKIHIEYMDIKNQLADILTKGNFTRDEWNHFCVCSTSAISVLPIVLKWCRKERKKMQVKKESQQNRSRWWIWSRDAAKGIVMCLPPLHQKARGKQDMKVKYLRTEQQPRTVRLVVGASSSDYSEWNADEKWSSQAWKSDQVLCGWTTSRFVHTAHGQIYCWWRWYGLSHRYRIRPAVRIQIIIAQGERPSAKDVGPILKRWNTRQ